LIHGLAFKKNRSAVGFFYFHTRELYAQRRGVKSETGLSWGFQIDQHEIYSRRDPILLYLVFDLPPGVSQSGNSSKLIIGGYADASLRHLCILQ
jgi:hypothetical protein